MTLLQLEEKTLLKYDFLDKNDVKLLLMHFFQIQNYTEFILKQNEPITVIPQFSVALKRLIKGEPVQYITTTSYFYGRDFTVNKNVLIPRPETEELVDFFIKDTLNKPGTVIDVGTGSGIIAISISEHTNHFVYAGDISKKALKVAIQNDLTKGVKFLHGDLLRPFINEGIVANYIIANLPYIKATESLEPRVKDYEPKRALYLPKKNIYARLFRQIKKLASTEKGLDIYLEFGTDQGLELKTLAKMSFGIDAKIEVRRDMQGRERFLIIKGVYGN